ncbi:DUF6850 family outer membrane beta-barrel protein [Pedobacter helvus]|uniref:DUF6850 family outer membrane beta-barrel protein n=1 Tax=Pedobacter helvus TaxID=2563444 RepID=A0ABW9JC31_9SPHI|nr:DUF6850 family outer membrane beta-barrel protein [Pedobacter ureilyticus]
MSIRKLMFLGVFLSVASCYAQDTTIYSRPVEEQLSPIVKLRDELYASPSLHAFYRKYSYSLLSVNLENTKKDLYLRQEGSGVNSLRINSESFTKNHKGVSLWGNAYYTNDKIKQVNFNETLDYHYVYPYVMADTVGGDLNAESYYFGGGISKLISGLRFALQGSFKGIQSFRNVDPRPKNISSDIDFAFSIGKEIPNNKAISIDLNLKKYIQNNSLDFANELGFPLVYHDAGLGVYNELLAGTRMLAYYKGLMLGAQLNFVPTNLDGFSAQIGFNRFQLNKELDKIADRISAIKENRSYLLLAYHHQRQKNNLIVKLKGYFNKREGLEATFANTGQTSLYKVSEEVRYTREKLGIKFSAAYGKAKKKWKWFLGVEGTFNTDNENYFLPDRFIDYQTVSAGVFATLTKPLGKTLLNIEVKANQLKVLSDDYSWGDINTKKGIYQMLNANYIYLTTDIFTTNATLRFDFPINNKLGAFSNVTGAYTYFDKINKARNLIFSLGVVF